MIGIVISDDIQHYVLELYRKYLKHCLMTQLKQKTTMLHVYTLQCTPNYTEAILPRDINSPLFITVHRNHHALTQVGQYDQLRIGHMSTYWSLVFKQSIAIPTLQKANFWPEHLLQHDNQALRKHLESIPLPDDLY